MWPAQEKWTYPAAAAVLLLMVLLPFDWFLDDYTMLMTFIAINTMVTVGLCLLMGYTGQVSLGQTAFYGHRRLRLRHSQQDVRRQPVAGDAIAAAATGALRLCHRLSHIQAQGQLPGHGHPWPGPGRLHPVQRVGRHTPEGLTAWPASRVSLSAACLQDRCRRSTSWSGSSAWRSCLYAQNIVRSRTGGL